ncbi:MAG: hypothetical protein ACR2PT_08270 [Endozoicomonas sp.]
MEPLDPRTGQPKFNPPDQLHEAGPQARPEDTAGDYRGRSASPIPETDRSTPSPPPLHEQSLTDHTPLSGMSIELSSLAPHRRPYGNYEGYLETRYRTPEFSIEDTPSIGPLRRGYFRPDCEMDSPHILEEKGVKPVVLEWGFTSFLETLQDYIHKRNFSSYRIETKLLWLSELRNKVSGYITQLKSATHQLWHWQWQTTDRLQAFEALLKQIRVEYRHLLGWPEVGRVYLPEDEVSVEEKFAHGNSASVARIKYRDDFDAVFKSSSVDDEVTSQAARRFGLVGKASELGLDNRSVLFCEIDSLLGTSLVPETWYGVHGNTSGSCQKFIDGAPLVKGKTIELPPERVKEIRDQLLDIWKGNWKELGFSLSFRREDPFSASHPPSQEQLEELLDQGKLMVVQTKPAAVEAVDLHHPEVQRCLADAEVLDYLCGNVDRNMSNILYTQETIDGQTVLIPKLIDNDLSFAPAHDAENSYLNVEGNAPETAHMVRRPPRFINQETAAMLTSMRSDSLYRLAELHHLSDADQAALMSRHRALTEAIERGDCVLVKKWNEDTYQNAIQYEDAYLQRASTARRESLENIFVGSPEHAADAIATMLPIEGGEFIGKLLARMSYETKNPKAPCIKNILRAFDRNHCIRSHAEATSIVILLNTLLANRPDISSQTEGVWMLRKFLGQNTKPDVAAALVFRAWEVSELKPPGFFNYDILNEILQNTTLDAGMNPEAYDTYRINSGLKRCCRTLSKTMTASPQDGETQAVVKNASMIAYSMLLDADPFNEDWKQVLRFWERLTLKTTPEFQQRKQVSLERAPELTHAYSRLTPVVIRHIGTLKAEDIPGFIKKELIPGLPLNVNGKTASQVHDLLCQHFLEGD